MLKTQKGFTLIELVMVIVILGILAAVAIPRYIALQTDARIAAVNGMNGAVAGAAAIVNARAIISGQTGATGTVTVGGVTINTVYGFPRSATAGGIDSAIANLSGFTFTAGTPARFELNGAPTPTACRVEYTAPTVADGNPVIAIVTTGC